MYKRLMGIYQFIYFLCNRFFENRGTQNAGALTYTTLFAVVPMMTVLFVMLSSIPDFQEAGDKIQQFIFQNFVPTAGDKVYEYLRSFTLQAKSLTWIGIGFLVATTFMMLVTIESTFNSIWRVKKSRKGLQRFLLYWALLSLGPLLLGAGFAVSTYVMSLSLISGPDALPWVAHVLRYIPILLSIGGFTLFYVAIPNTNVPFSHALVSGVFTALLIEMARMLFGVYVKTFPSYQFIYGAFAVVPLFLLWIYVSWVIVLLGCELCCCLGLRHYLWNRNVPPMVNALKVLSFFYKAQLKGTVVTHRALQEAGYSFPEEEVDKMLCFFKEEHLICEAEGDEGWILCRDVHQYSLKRFISYSVWPLPRAEQITLEEGTPWLDRFKEGLVRLDQVENDIFAGSLAAFFIENPLSDA